MHVRDSGKSHPWLFAGLTIAQETDGDATSIPEMRQTNRNSEHLPWGRKVDIKLKYLLTRSGED
ncbi:MAG: hypothetical protein LDL41_05355 [Coleofasciculus sp. S288]|nr:hypothetical protein [Coleofasciculus sp. S288]